MKASIKRSPKIYAYIYVGQRQSLHSAYTANATKHSIFSIQLIFRLFVYTSDECGMSIFCNAAQKIYRYAPRRSHSNLARQQTCWTQLIRRLIRVWKICDLFFIHCRHQIKMNCVGCVYNIIFRWCINGLASRPESPRTTKKLMCKYSIFIVDFIIILLCFHPQKGYGQLICCDT